MAKKPNYHDMGKVKFKAPTTHKAGSVKKEKKAPATTATNSPAKDK